MQWLNKDENQEGKEEKDRREDLKNEFAEDANPLEDDFALLASDEEDSFDRSALLDDFLGDIQPVHTKGASRIPDLSNDDPLACDYELLPVSDELEHKIQELAKITDSIETKQLDEPVLKYNLENCKIPYTKILNKPQLAATLSTEGPYLVIAGAGSGKTRVIVHRVAFLLESGVSPEEILLLTFTRKAAKEMLTRAEQLLKSKSASRVAGGTFHSFAVYAFRRYGKLAGIPNNFTIADTADAEDIIDLLRTELKFNQKSKKFPKKARILEIISASKNCQKSIKEIIHNDFTGLIDFIADLEFIANAYEKYKQMSAIFDFDDLMTVLLEALNKKPLFKEKLQRDFKYIMVDEFQDTNLVQKEIVDVLAAKHRNIMVVGDDAQSIYAFRGANLENILRFPQTYPDCKVVKLNQNYRSNQAILNFTNDIIGKARIGYKKELFSENDKNILPGIARFYSQEDEAEFIVDRILELSEKGISFGEMAILNRADWHNRFIQAELNKRGIPYVVVGGFRFNERMHIKDIIAYLRVIYNPLDAVSWHRLLKLIPGIGKVTATNIVKQLRQQNGAINFAIFSKRNYFEELAKLGKVLQKASLPEVSLAQKLELIKLHYEPIIKMRESDFETRLMDIDVLIQLARKYKDIEKFLADFALDPPAKNLAGQLTPLIDEGEESGKLTISTVHSAKGLEWYAVFVPHALDGMFPSVRAKNVEEIEEERRLFYVACSRAKEILCLTFPSMVASYDAVFTYPCRFMGELDRTRFELKVD